MKKQILAVLLTCILLFSSCSSTSEESPSDTLSSMPPLPSIVNTSSEIDFEVGPIDMDSIQYMLPASIDRTDSLAALYDGENIMISPIFLDWYIDTDNTKYDIDNRITVLSFVDGFTWGQFEHGMMYVKNTNNEDFPSSSYLFTNDQIGVISSDPSEGIRVFENNGDLFAQLNFDYGQKADESIEVLHGVPNCYENIIISMTCIGNSNQYVVFYVKNMFFPNMENEENPNLNENGMTVHVAIFDENGKQIDDYPLNNFYFSPFSKNFVVLYLDSFARENEIVLLNTSYDGLVVVDLINKTVNTAPSLSEIEPLLNESPNIILNDSVRKDYKIKQEPCPLFLNRLNTGEITIASKENPEVVLETIAAGYDPAFYSFNSDGSCNVVFTIPESSDE